MTTIEDSARGHCFAGSRVQNVSSALVAAPAKVMQLKLITLNTQPVVKFGCGLPHVVSCVLRAGVCGNFASNLVSWCMFVCRIVSSACFPFCAGGPRITPPHPVGSNTCAKSLCHTESNPTKILATQVKYVPVVFCGPVFPNMQSLRSPTWCKKMCARFLCQASQKRGNFCVIRCVERSETLRFSHTVGFFKVFFSQDTRVHGILSVVDTASGCLARKMGSVRVPKGHSWTSANQDTDILFDLTKTNANVSFVHTFI